MNTNIGGASGANYVLAVDVDGVCADLHVEWLRRYNQDYSDSLDVSSITEWGMHQFVKPECGVRIYDYIQDPDIYLHTPIIPGALDAVNTIKKMGVRVVFVTTSTVGTMGAKYKWLLDNGFIDGVKDYIETGDKSLVRAHALLDDYDKNLLGFEGNKFLFDAPWNRNRKSEQVKVVYGWQEMVEIWRVK